MTRKSAVSGVFPILLALSGCGRAIPDLRVKVLSSPAPQGSIVPQVTQAADGSAILSWQEPSDGGGYTFRMASRQRGTWLPAHTIASGPEISMFTADLPGVAAMPGGGLVAYWEIKDNTGRNRYATSIQISTSLDGGATWSPPKRPYSENHSGQHSFLSAFPVGQDLGLVWLDAQRQAEESVGAIGLRYVSVNGRGRLSADSFIDPIACECCPTSAAPTRRGPVVVYRGRQEPSDAQPEKVDVTKPTVRDIQITRLQGGKWTPSHRVHADNWVINGCPDNGPAVDANGDEVAVAWWTRSDKQPKVQLAFSSDAGDTFGPAIRVDLSAAEGQVTVALIPGRHAAIVGWLEDGKVWARWVGADGKMGLPLALGPSTRHSRLPRWIAAEREVLAVWTAQKAARTVQAARIGF